MDESWREQARCRNEPYELFFPSGSSELEKLKETAAKRICGICPVKSECLEYALSMPHSDIQGVWAGTNEEERKRLRRRRNRVAI